MIINLVGGNKISTGSEKGKWAKLVEGDDDDNLANSAILANWPHLGFHLD